MVNQTPQAPTSRINNRPTSLFDANVHLLDYWHIIRNRLPLFIGVVVAVVTLVAVSNFTKTPIFQSRCRMLIEPSSLNITKLQGVYDPTDNARDFQARRNFLQTQMELIQSDRVLAEAFTKFDFASKEEFRNSIQPLQSFRNRVGVSLIRNTFLVDVTFDWKDPQLAASVANYIAQVYVNDYRERQLGFSGRGVHQLREQLVEMKQSRLETLAALVAFKRERHLIDLNDAQKLLVDRMSSLNNALIEARVEETATQAAMESIQAWEKSGGTGDQLPEVLGNQSITAFKLEHLNAQAKLLDLLNKYGKTHPTVQTQTKVVDKMAEAVQTEIANSIASVRQVYERAKLRSTMLEQALLNLEDRAFELDESACDYRILEDSYKAAENSYRLVINRINEINITKNAGDLAAGGNIMVIDAAKPPKIRAYPRRGRNIAIAGMLGMMLAAGLCFLLDYLDSSLKSKEEIEQVLGGVAVLGFVPRLDSSESEMGAVSSSRSSLAEAFRSIRTSLGLSFAGRQQRAFIVTSSNPGEGKTLSSFNLAVAMARDGKRVLLLEGDMRKPRLRKLFGEAAPAKNGTGLSKVLVGADELKNATWSYPAIAGLDVAFCGPIAPNPAELLGSSRFKEVLKQALDDYDMVIIDSPPVLNVADTAILAGTGLPVVFVVRSFKTERQQAVMAAEQIATVQGNIVGVIVNNVDAQSKSYAGYYYGGRYYAAQPTSYGYQNDELGTEA
jgi:capsular exopolysaccharide synthesis family protein